MGKQFEEAGEDVAVGAPILAPSHGSNVPDTEEKVKLLRIKAQKRWMTPKFEELREKVPTE